MIRQKIEIRFEKTEAVRYISHHDLMRAFQRALRRAALPVRLTEGFNPRPRLIFPAALEVGVVSLDEVAELELIQWIPLSEIINRLEKYLPPGLRVRTVNEIEPVRKARQLSQIRYQLHLREAGLQVEPQALSKLMGEKVLIYHRAIRRSGDQAQVKKVDLRPSLEEGALDDQGDLVLVVKPGPNGLARPLEYLSLLTERPERELKGLRITKLQMILSPNLPTLPQDASPKE